MPGEAYRVEEDTDNPANSSAEDVIDLALPEAADPRPHDHSDGHLHRHIKYAFLGLGWGVSDDWVFSSRAKPTNGNRVAR